MLIVGGLNISIEKSFESVLNSLRFDAVVFDVFDSKPLDWDGENLHTGSSNHYFYELNHLNDSMDVKGIHLPSFDDIKNILVQSGDVTVLCSDVDPDSVRSILS